MKLGAYNIVEVIIGKAVFRALGDDPEGKNQQVADKLMEDLQALNGDGDLGNAKFYIVQGPSEESFNALWVFKQKTLYAFSARMGIREIQGNSPKEALEKLIAEIE